MTPADPRIPPTSVPEGSRPVVVARDQPEYVPLPAVATPGGQVITRWHLSDEERRAIFEGADVFLTVWIGRHRFLHPVLMSVGPLDWTRSEPESR